MSNYLINKKFHISNWWIHIWSDGKLYKDNRNGTKYFSKIPTDCLNYWGDLYRILWINVEIGKHLFDVPEDFDHDEYNRFVNKHYKPDKLFDRNEMKRLLRCFMRSKYGIAI